MQTFVWVQAYACAFNDICAWMCICEWIYVHVRVFMRICVYAFWVSGCDHEHWCVSFYVHVYVLIWMYIFMCVCMCMCKRKRVYAYALLRPVILVIVTFSFTLLNQRTDLWPFKTVSLIKISCSCLERCENCPSGRWSLHAIKEEIKRTLLSGGRVLCLTVAQKKWSFVVFFIPMSR